MRWSSEFLLVHVIWDFASDSFIQSGVIFLMNFILLLWELLKCELS